MENNKNEERLDRMEISIKNLEGSVETINGHITTIQASIVTMQEAIVGIQESIASIPGLIAKAIEEIALMTARGFREVHEKIDAHRRETKQQFADVGKRFDRLELVTGIRDDLRL